MKKLHSHDVMSDRICLHPGCNKPIKLRMVELKDARLCYKHHCKKESGRAHYVNANPRRKRIVKNLPVKDFS
jgi:hypothetical protein